MLACSVFHRILLSRSVGLNKCEGRGQAGVDLQLTHIFAATISARIALKGIPSWQLSLEYRSGKSLNPTQCQQYSREISNSQPLFFEGGAACCLFLSNIVGTASGLSFSRFCIPSLAAMRVSLSKQSSLKWSLQRYEFAVGPLQPARVLRTCLVQRSLRAGKQNKLIFSL